MSQYKLTTELLKLSTSSKWDKAKLEWDIADIERAKEAETCLCGHFPILEICTIHNTKTGHDARVGNCCVKKFNDKSNKIFRAVAKIKKHVEKSVNSETLDLALRNDWINLKSYNFYMDILRRRNLTEKQIKWKVSINEQITYFVNRKNEKKKI